MTTKLKFQMFPMAYHFVKHNYEEAKTDEDIVDLVHLLLDKSETDSSIIDRNIYSRCANVIFQEFTGRTMTTPFITL